METPAGSWFVAALLLVLFSSVRAQNRVVHFAVDESLVMSPPETVPGLTSILWKFNGNLVAEWVKDKVPLEYYSQFKGRTTLNTGNGLLTISSMTAADAGIYTVETNNKVQTVGYDAKVLKKVPKPKVVVQPLGCNPTSPDCYLTCDGDTTGAEPVTYSWKRDGEDWGRSERRINIINNEEIQSVKTFSCGMKNSVSEEQSDPFNNLFFKEKQPESSTGLIVGLFIAALIVVLIIALCVLYWKTNLLKCDCDNPEAGHGAKHSSSQKPGGTSELQNLQSTNP